MRHFFLPSLHLATPLVFIFLLTTPTTSLSTSPLNHHHINKPLPHHPSTTHSYVTSRNLSPRNPFPDPDEPLSTIPAPNLPSTAGDKASDTCSLRPLRIFSLPVIVFRALSFGGIATGTPLPLVVVPGNKTKADIATDSEEAAGTIGERNYNPHSIASTPDCTYNGSWEQFPPPGCSAGSSLSPPRIFALPSLIITSIKGVLGSPVSKPRGRIARNTTASGEVDKEAEGEKANGLFGEPHYNSPSIASTPDCTYNGGWEQFPPPGCSGGSSITPPRIFALSSVVITSFFRSLMAIPVQMMQSWAEPDWDLVRKTVNYIFASEEEKRGAKEYIPVRSTAGSLAVPKIFVWPGIVLGFLADRAVAKEGEGSGDGIGYAWTWTAILFLATFLAWSLWAGSGSVTPKRHRDGQVKAKESGSYDYSIGWHEWAERLGWVHPAELR